MPLNGSGTYNLPNPPVFPAVAGTTIKASDFNTIMTDMASAITAMIARDGQSTITGVLQWAQPAANLAALGGVALTGAQTIAGVKTFSSAPVSSAAASAANELMRKGEVDSALGGSASRAFLVGSATDPAHAVRRDQVPAEVKSALGASGAAPIYGCRAWVLFDMTRNAAGATDSNNTARFLYASGNVAQVVRSSPRSATVVFAQGLTPNGYTVSGTTRHLSGVYAGVVCLDGNDPLRSSQCDLSFHRSSDGNPITPEWVAVQFIGN